MYVYRIFSDYIIKIFTYNCRYRVTYTVHASAIQFEQVRLHCIRFLRIFVIARKGQVGLRLYGAVLSPFHPGLRPGCRIYNSNNLSAVVFAFKLLTLTH